MEKARNIQWPVAEVKQEYEVIIFHSGGVYMSVGGAGTDGETLSYINQFEALMGMEGTMFPVGNYVASNI